MCLHDCRRSMVIQLLNKIKFYSIVKPKSNKLIHIHTKTTEQNESSSTPIECEEDETGMSPPSFTLYVYNSINQAPIN